VKFFSRAAALSAAALSFCAAIVAAQPSMALEVEPAPFQTRYIDHASATISSDLAAPEAPAVEIFSTDEVPSVPSHADATLDDAAAVASQPLVRTIPALVEAHADELTLDAEHECLAQAVYFESKGEPLEGQLAVAEVIMNRAASGRFPASICGVVKQKSQFSFVRGGRIPDAPRSSAAWRTAVAISSIALQDLAESRGSNAMFFHARYVSPGWRNLRRVGTIGNHVFYR
jgi:spore germination cell wall hydrolase CwlJ-like protein